MNPAVKRESISFPYWARFRAKFKNLGIIIIQCWKQRETCLLEEKGKKRSNKRVEILSLLERARTRQVKPRKLRVYFVVIVASGMIILISKV